MLNLDDIKPRGMEFELGGKSYSVPTIDAMDADPVLDLLTKGEGVERADVITLFRAVLERHAPDALRQMTLAQLKALVAEWTKTGDVGE